MAREGIRGNTAVSDTLHNAYDMSLGDNAVQTNEPVVTFTMATLQVVWSGRTGGGGSSSTMSLQGSNNGTTWVDMVSVSVNTATGDEMLVDPEFGCKFLRANFIQGNTATGTITVTMIAKD